MPAVPGTICSEPSQALVEEVAAALGQPPAAWPGRSARRECYRYGATTPRRAAPATVNRLAAALYDRALSGMEQAGLRDWRRELLSGLSGRVIEIGAGTGANLDLYPPAVSALVLAEPDRHMRQRLSARAARHPRPVEVVPSVAERLPFPDGAFDAAVSTLVLCSAADPFAVLREVRRVLRPGGPLVVIEHVGAAPASALARWQRRLEPAWRRLAGNCHLTRDTASVLAQAGFDTSTLVTEDMRRAPGIVRPAIRGRASAPAA